MSSITLSSSSKVTISKQDPVAIRREAEKNISRIRVLRLFRLKCLMLSSLTRKAARARKGARGVFFRSSMSRGVGCCRAYTYSLLSEDSGKRDEMEQLRDRTKRVGSNKRQIYSSESRDGGEGTREESKYKQAR